ncbi:hypothetical protein EOW65_03170 [Sinirhodobacter ferrireducens]|uniref:Uncharacterized protein n=1 Tax=Paenirhodobacter ferrireducens TaxID=1215032 RepID=A0A443LRS1_9RHOB|nr:hypothetical protein [Sinirhodobacter ferrireducens]RWR51872.1 hypothetical protein EOW65_03170 [Sinirhodobacter ferrireducens]
MTELTEREIEKIEAERAKIFTAPWFRDLVAGRLGLGDTFWIGNYGVLLGVVPLVVLVSGLLYAQLPDLMTPFLQLFAAALGLWRLVTLRALARARTRLAAPGAWPIVGLIWTLGEAITAFVYAATL